MNPTRTQVCLNPQRCSTANTFVGSTGKIYPAEFHLLVPQHRPAVSCTDFTTKLLRQFDNIRKITTLGTREDLRLNK